MTKIKPSLGVCYYPEHWPQEKWAEDAARMVECGIEYVRIAEFAWSRFEPARDQFSFEWLDAAIEILANASVSLADKAIAGFTVNQGNIDAAVGRNPILVTALNPVIGYEKGAAIAKKAYAEGRSVKDVAREETELTDEELDRLLDPAALTEGGIKH